MMALSVCIPAPDFSVPGVIGETRTTVSLAEHRGKKNVVLAFYPLNWTPV